ncbi:unnamed protein product [Closterium sp. Yama58-4]|nr:unnamed protein product [Closterium sp. Yama58-4]
MATLRSVFILALILASLPALYAASAPPRGDVAAGGSAAGVDAARWGRKLLEASSGAAASGADADLNQLDADVGGEEGEQVGEVTDVGLDEAVRVLLSSDADVEQQGGAEENEEEVGEGEVTDGLDEAVRMLMSLKKFKKKVKKAASKAGGLAKDAASKAGGLAKEVVEKGGADAVKAAVNAYSSGQGAKGALIAGSGSLARTAKTMV